MHTIIFALVYILIQVVQIQKRAKEIISMVFICFNHVYLEKIKKVFNGLHVVLDLRYEM